jgi:DNA relaxase NicK
MDKEDAPAETLASKMRATYMQLCTTLYNEYQESKESKKGVFPGNVEGNYLSGLPEVKNKEDVISGDFSFNVISESKKYIKIYTKNIKIENQTTIKI